ncbi:hypothetical protein GCM10009753_24460 [Streptantibioticus ferralitis]
MATAVPLALVTFLATGTSASAETNPSHTASLNPSDPPVGAHQFGLEVDGVLVEWVNGVTGLSPHTAEIRRGSQRSQIIDDLIGCHVAAQTVTIEVLDLSGQPVRKINMNTTCIYRVVKSVSERSCNSVM